MIYISGDTHGEIDHKNISSDKVRKACGGLFPNYVIILGDFGFIWKNDPEDETEKWWLNWIEQKPWITLFLDGNHENHHRIKNLPTVNLFGNLVQQVSDKIFHLIRGNVYTIEDKTFFCMGGAESTDKEGRKAYIDWWPEEVPSYMNYYNALNNIENHSYTVDYVLTHTPPKYIHDKYYKDQERNNDSTAIMLEDIRTKLSFDKWFFGHMHDDRVFEWNYYARYKKGYVIE